ncbi:MFS transporter [Georgenia halophila]|uniref:MFS transporter n=1 Tax=Georgenia halophila TaxID=620889 RepID=A0ABP8LEM1_9MICO
MTVTAVPTRPTAVLGLLFVAAFTMDCAEMLVLGMLDLISAGLAVSVPAAGALVTASAAGCAIGGPVLALLTTRLDRRRVLLWSAAVFVLLHLVPVLVDGYSLFLVARVAIGALQGLFIAAAFTTATSIVPPEQAGRAIAVVISGCASASALGMPMGTVLGYALGWRASFVAVVVVGAGVLLAAAVVLPSVPTSPEAQATGQSRHAFAPRVLAVLAVCCLIFAGIQSALTYLVPFLGEVTGVSAAAAIGGFLMLYGVATTVGSAAGGRFADTDAARTLMLGSVGVAASLFTMHLLGDSAVVVAAAVLVLGLCGMGMAPAMQHRVVTLAGPGAPLAASLPASAVNAGIAGGSLAGGAAIDHASLPAAILTGAVIALAAVAAAVATRRLRPPPAPTDGHAAPEAAEPVAA